MAVGVLGWPPAAEGMLRPAVAGRQDGGARGPLARYLRSMETLLWLEATAPSVWLRESGPGFFGSLILHALGMAFLVGAHVATDLRVLGVAPAVPLSRMAALRPVARAGLTVVAVSGAALLLAYPTKALTNPLFYGKLVALGAALAAGRAITAHGLAAPERDAGPLPASVKATAVASLLLWAGTITMGRLLAYTYRVLMAADVHP